MTINLVFLVAAIVLFCLFGFEVIPENGTVFLGVGLACFTAAHITWPRIGGGS